MVRSHGRRGGARKLDGLETSLSDAVKVDTDSFSVGHNYMMVPDPDSSNIYVIDSHGDVVAGGPSAVGVTDATDFGELLEHTVNTVAASSSTSIYLSPPSVYTIKSQADLNYAFAIYGPGRNRINIKHGAAIENNDAIVSTNPSGNIFRMDGLKFDGKGGPGRPNRWFNFDGMAELLLTNVEMRTVNTAGLEAANIASPNYFTNCWFIDGGGLTLDTGSEVSIMGCDFRGETVSLSNIDNLIVRGNVNPTWSVTNCTYETGEVPKHVTGSRSRGTWYQNQGPWPIEVNIDARADSSGTDVRLVPDVNSSESSNPAGERRLASAPDASDVIGITFTVQPGDYYKLRDLGGSWSINRWVEQEICL